MNIHNCWYNKVCKKFNTEQCNELCVRYSEMLHMMKYSGLPEKWFKNQHLAAVQVDINSYQK